MRDRHAEKKVFADAGLPWPKALPIAMMYMRMRRRARANLSPFKVLFAAPPQMGMTAGGKTLISTLLCEDTILIYCSNLASALADVKRQVSAALPWAATGPLHSLKPGDYVLVKQTSVKVAEIVVAGELQEKEKSEVLSHH